MKNNRLVDSVRTVDAFMRLEIPDGVYLSAVRLTARGGHCFLLRIEDERTTTAAAASDELEPRAGLSDFIELCDLNATAQVRFRGQCC